MARSADNPAMKFLALAFFLVSPLLAGCGPTPPDSQQVDLGVDRSKAVQAETQKRVDDMNKTLSGK
jgi:hypothetical protein